MPGLVSTNLPQSVKGTENMAREGVNANQVFASGFPDSTNESDLYLFFGSYGEVTSVKLLINKKKNALAGAFITFRDCRCAELVLEDQKRRQMFFKGAKINVREAYRDRQTGDMNRQGGGQAGGQRGGYGSDRGNNYDRGYSSGGGDNPFLQQTPAFSSSSGSGMMSDNRSSNQYSTGNQGQSQGYAMDNRRDDGYNSANRRSDNYNQGYNNTGARQQGYNDNYNRSPQGNYNRQENVSMDASRRYEEPNRSTGYQDDFNRSSSRFDNSYYRDTSRTQSADSGSWADIMDREDRFGDRRVDNRSFDRSRDVGATGGTSYNRDSGMNVRQDNYSTNYNRDNRGTGGYDNQRQGSGFDGGRSGATGGYDNQRANTGYDSGRSGYDSYRSSERPVQQSADNFRSQPAANYVEPARYSNEPMDRGFSDAGMSRSGNYGREHEMASGLNRSGNFGRAQERFDQRDSRKRGSEWVGGYEEVPRKQMATQGRDDRPVNFNVRTEATQNPFIQSLNNIDTKSTGLGQNRDDTMSRGPGATSTPRGFVARGGRVNNRGKNVTQRSEVRSGFVGGPDRKDRTPARGAPGGARRITTRGGVSSGPSTRQPVNQGRPQVDRNFGQARASDRRGWVGGGSTDMSPNRLMAGNLSPQGGMNERQRFQGNLMQQQGMGMSQSPIMQQQQLQQMQLMRQQQQMNMQQQQRGVPLGGGGGGMQGIMSTLAQLLQNLNSKGRGPQQGQMQKNFLRELNPLERDVVAEVKRSLNVEETPLFASAIIMMRPMDDEVIRIFTQLPQGILTKILRGAAPDVITQELAKIKNTKSYDNRAEARFHVLRKLLIVLYKVSREQLMARPFGPVRPVLQLKRPLDVSRQRLMLAKRRLNMRGGRGGFATRSVGSATKTVKTDGKTKEDKKETEKVEGKKEDKKEGAVTTRGRGGFRRGFGIRGRGGFRGRGAARGNMRGTFRGRGNFRGRGRGGAPKPNGEAKKPETKTTTPAKKTAATTPKATKKAGTTNGSAKKATTPAVKKTPVTRKTVAKKTPSKTTPKTTPAKTTPGKAAAAKTTPGKTPTKK